jgi:hypothetical protein
MDQKLSDSTEYRGILDNFGGHAYDPGVPSTVSPQQRAAISRDAPIRDAPFTMTNPFDLSQTSVDALIRAFLWNKLLFDSRLLARNPFFSSDSNLISRPNLFDPTPMNPQEGAPILPQQFR